MELEEFITESEIVSLTGAKQPSIHKMLKSNMDRMVTRKLTKRVTLYLRATLPEKIKKLLEK